MDLPARFADRFGGTARVFRAPGRVNLIGEHTDYNEGFVMPAALDRATSVAIGPRDDGTLVVHSEALNETAKATLAPDRLQPTHTWSDYVFGVAAQLVARGMHIGGANMLVASDVPLGAGLSSSASLEVAVARALLDRAGEHLDATTVARLCQRAENEFVGARCGIMDQFIAAHGQTGSALMLDCRTLIHQPIALPGGVRLVVCNTMVRHSVAAGEYNARRADCERAARALAARLPHVSALRDVTLADLDRYAGELASVERRRARHIVTENQRVLDLADALERADRGAIMLLMAASHASLRDDFEVSCRELDVMVELATSMPGTWGARMTGGGFGGCTVNLVDEERVDEFVARVKEGYARRAGVEPAVYVGQA